MRLTGHKKLGPRQTQLKNPSAKVIMGAARAMRAPAVPERERSSVPGTGASVVGGAAAQCVHGRGAAPVHAHPARPRRDRFPRKDPCGEDVCVS